MVARERAVFRDFPVKGLTPCNVTLKPDQINEKYGKYLSVWR